jgi:hypothetical protein
MATAAGFLWDAPPGADRLLSRVTVLEWRSQADKIDGHPGESRQPDGGDREQGGADYSGVGQELGVGGPRPPLPVGAIANFEFHGALILRGTYHLRARVRTAAHFALRPVWNAQL